MKRETTTDAMAIAAFVSLGLSSVLAQNQPINQANPIAWMLLAGGIALAGWAAVRMKRGAPAND